MEEDDDWLLAWTELFERLLFPLPPIVGVLGVVAFGPFTPPPPPPPPPTPAPVLLPLLEGVELSVRDLGPGRRGDGGTWGVRGKGKVRERERVQLTSFPWSLPIDVVFPLLLSSNSSYLF